MTSQQSAPRPTAAIVFLSATLIFLAVGGLFSGIALIQDPSGAKLQMEVGLLERTPFKDYLLPGLWLVFIWGVGGFFAAFALWARPDWKALAALTRLIHEHWAWGLTLLIGIVLAIWLTVQVFTLPTLAPIQFVMYAVAIILIVVPLLPVVRRYYRI